MKEEDRRIYIQEGSNGHYRIYEVPFLVATAICILLDAEELVFHNKKLEITDAHRPEQGNLL